MRAALRRTLTGLAALALAFTARRANAEPLPVKLAWEAPPECPSQGHVLAELERIARVKPGRVLTGISAQAKIERTNDGRYRLRLRTEREDRQGTTELDASTCLSLERGVTLVLALALGDGVEMVDDKPTASVPPPSGPPPGPEAPRIVPTATVPDRDEAHRRTSLRWSPWIGAAGAWGLLARPSIGNRIGVALGQARWEAVADVTFWPPVSAARVQGIDASFWAVIGSIGACGRIPIEGGSVAACAAFEAGAIRGRSLGAFHDSAATAPWYAVRPSVVLTAPMYGFLKVRAEADLSIAPVPPRFAILSLGDVYVVSRYVPALFVGLGFDR
jgi:hypothetical protein